MKRPGCILFPVGLADELYYGSGVEKKYYLFNSGGLDKIYSRERAHVPLRI